MYKIEISANPDKPPLKYTYLVGAYTVGIITPSRKRYFFPIHVVSGRPFGSRIGENDGFADSRLSPNEIAAYVIKHRLL
jgi:hypothetical protein